MSWGHNSKGHNINMWCLVKWWLSNSFGQMAIWLDNRIGLSHSSTTNINYIAYSYKCYNFYMSWLICNHYHSSVGKLYEILCGKMQNVLWQNTKYFVAEWHRQHGYDYWSHDFHYMNHMKNFLLESYNYLWIGSCYGRVADMDK